MKRRKQTMRRKSIVALALTATMTISMSMTAFAGQWKQDTTGWWYVEDNGNYPTNQWKEIDGKQYYFDGSGYMLANTTTPDGYQVGADGAWIEDGITTTNIQTWVCAMDYYDGPQGTPSYFGVQIGNAEEYVPDIYALYDSTGTIPYTVDNKPEWINCWDVQITGEIFQSPEGPAIKVVQLTVIQ